MTRHTHTWRYVLDDEYAGRGMSPVGYWRREPCQRCRYVRLLRLLATLVAVVVGWLILLDLTSSCRSL